MGKRRGIGGALTSKTTRTKLAGNQPSRSAQKHWRRSGACDKSPVNAEFHGSRAELSAPSASPRVAG